MDHQLPPSPFPQAPTESQPSTTPPIPQKGKGSLFIILLVVIVLLAGAVASVAGYLILSGKGLPVEFDFGTSEQTPTPSPTPAQSSEELSNEENIRGIVQTALTVKNYSLLIDSLHPVTTLTLEATECCGQQSIAEIISQLSYLDESTTWTFDPTNSTIKNIKENNPDTYAAMTLGISDNKYVFGYTVNKTGKISDIRIAATYDLLIPASVEAPPPGTPLPTRRPTVSPTQTPTATTVPSPTETE